MGATNHRSDTTANGSAGTHKCANDNAHYSSDGSCTDQHTCANANRNSRAINNGDTDTVIAYCLLLIVYWLLVIG